MSLTSCMGLIDVKGIYRYHLLQKHAGMPKNWPTSQVRISQALESGNVRLRQKKMSIRSMIRIRLRSTTIEHRQGQKGDPKATWLTKIFHKSEQ